MEQIKQNEKLVKVGERVAEKLVAAYKLDKAEPLAYVSWHTYFFEATKGGQTMLLKVYTENEVWMLSGTGWVKVGYLV